MHGLNEIDYGIIGIITVSVIFGFLRGFVRESMSLMTWIVAGILGTLYCDEVGAWFTSISIVGVRLLLAFILIVLTTLIVGGIVSHLLSKLIKSTKFSITDRIIGILFGLARGVFVIAIVILMVQPSIISKKEIWKSSVLVSQFEPASLWIKAQLPEDLLKFYENPSKNSDDLKKTIEKATQKATGNAEDSVKDVQKPIEKPLAKPLTDIEEEIGGLEKPFENIGELTDNTLSD
ncbi:MAG TPA: CvpA family protein [Gammaproteobacteria bacterium]|nr:CvpA family protein [Gammaproteobacteria bacterium]HRA42059.1 CvpA family protein [Gammaproteobacteria bacterium]